MKIKLVIGFLKNGVLLKKVKLLKVLECVTITEDKELGNGM